MLWLLVLAIVPGCDQRTTTAQPTFPTFQDDLDFLQQHGEIQLLAAAHGGVVALSARYQGRVMTSAVSPEGLSAGYVNRSFIEAGETGTPFDNFGGEDRFWLGPEGGQFGLYFPPEVAFNLDTWQVPNEMQTGAWDVSAASDTSATFTRSMRLTNYSGTSFDLHVERTVRLLSEQELASYFGAPVPAGLEWVAFETLNRVTNTGGDAWSPESGLPSIWILCMYQPFGTSWVVVPFEGSPAGEVVSSYFGEIPPERLEVRESYSLFKADGGFRSKIGVAPDRARPVLGSYSPEAGLLTLVSFTLPENARRYVNSQWEIQEHPYDGDVVNSYNDGPPGAGGFYEMESSSPALELAPGESYTHAHRTLHVEGSAPELDELVRAAFGVSASEIEAGTL
jgi:hypothetical protein